MLLSQTTSLFESSELLSKEEISLQDFLLKNDFYQFLYLSNSKNLKFHWADAVETCRYIQKDIKTLGPKYAEFKRLIETVNELKMTPVWIMGDNHIHQTNLHDLYHQIVMPEKFPHLRFQFKDFHDLSLIGPTGPFKRVDLRAWMNRRDHLNIVYKNVLSGALNPREFRLRTEGQVLCFYGSENDSCVFKVKQITQGGLLMNTEEMHFFDHVKNCSTIDLQMNADIFRLHGKESLSVIREKIGDDPRTLFFSHENRDRVRVRVPEIKSFLYSNSYNGRTVRTHYLFVPFKEIAMTNPQFSNIVNGFVGHVKNLILKEI